MSTGRGFNKGLSGCTGSWLNILPSSSDHSSPDESPSVRSASSDSSPLDIVTSSSTTVFGTGVDVRVLLQERSTALTDERTMRSYARRASRSASETPSSPSESERLANVDKRERTPRGRECWPRIFLFLSLLRVGRVSCGR